VLTPNLLIEGQPSVWIYELLTARSYGIPCESNLEQLVHGPTIGVGPCTHCVHFSHQGIQYELTVAVGNRGEHRRRDQVHNLISGI